MDRQQRPPQHIDGAGAEPEGGGCARAAPEAMLSRSGTHKALYPAADSASAAQPPPAARWKLARQPSELSAVLTEREGGASLDGLMAVPRCGSSGSSARGRRLTRQSLPESHGPVVVPENIREACDADATVLVTRALAKELDLRVASSRLSHLDVAWQLSRLDVADQALEAADEDALAEAELFAGIGAAVGLHVNHGARLLKAAGEVWGAFGAPSAGRRVGADSSFDAQLALALDERFAPLSRTPAGACSQPGPSPPASARRARSSRRSRPSAGGAGSPQRFSEAGVVRLLRLLRAELQLDLEVFVLAYVFVERSLPHHATSADAAPGALPAAGPGGGALSVLSGASWRPVLLGALLLAAKVWCDESIWLRDVRERLSAHFELGHLGVLEQAVAQRIGFRFGVPTKAFFTYLYSLRDFGRQRLRARGEEPVRAVRRRRRMTA